MTRRRRAFLTLLVSTLSNVPLDARGDLLADLPHSLGLVPGIVAGTPRDAVVEVGATQLVTFADATAGWARAQLPLSRGWDLELVGARTRAGTWRENRSEARLALEGPRGTIVAGVALVRAEVADWVRLRHGRGLLEAAYRVGPALFGARWEGPWRDSPQWSRSSLQLHARVETTTWSAGVWRPRDAYGLGEGWGAGLAARLDRRFTMGMRLRGSRTEMLLWLAAAAWRMGVALPVTSAVGAGPTVAVGWVP